jgi:hypothetical protein
MSMHRNRLQLEFYCDECESEYLPPWTAHRTEPEGFAGSGSDDDEDDDEYDEDDDDEDDDADKDDDADEDDDDGFL